MSDGYHYHVLTNLQYLDYKRLEPFLFYNLFYTLTYAADFEYSSLAPSRTL